MEYKGNKAELMLRVAKAENWNVKVIDLASNPEDAEYYLEAIQYRATHDPQKEIERIMSDYEANS